MPPPVDAMDVDKPAKGLFAQCNFVVVRSTGLSEDSAEKVGAVDSCFEVG